MSLVRTLHPSGIYVDSYQRTARELRAMERRAERYLAAPDEREPPVTVASLIRAAMRTKQLSSLDLIDRVSVAPTTVRKWIAGTITPSNASLRELAKVLDLDERQLRRVAGRDPGAVRIGTFNGGRYPVETGQAS